MAARIAGAVGAAYLRNADRGDDLVLEFVVDADFEEVKDSDKKKSA